MKQYEELIAEAMEARQRAYAPYSHFLVGAALLTENGNIYKGCNIENASYPAGNCAERTAMHAAVLDGQYHFSAIAIVGGRKDAKEADYCAPCGICRQVMREFCIPEHFQVIVAKSKEEYKVFTLAELLPESFGPKNIISE